MKKKHDKLSFSNEIVRCFTKNLRRLRKERCMSIKAAAAALGVAESTWSQWESGKRFPHCDLLNLIARLFEVRPCILLSVAPDECQRTGRCGNEARDCPTAVTQK